MGVIAYYSSSIQDFSRDDDDRIIGVLTANHQHALEGSQRFAWTEQLKILKPALASFEGRIFLECYVPRMGKRADAVILMHGLVFILEFKVGAREHDRGSILQAIDYALDFKNFHEGSHLVPIVPVLISTNSSAPTLARLVLAKDLVADPVVTNAASLQSQFRAIFASRDFPPLDEQRWMDSGYRPTPTIVEAAQALYRTHNVADIARSDAGAKNLRETSARVSEIIDEAKSSRTKAICFVTGVPGSGKTLAGLNVATRRSDEHKDEHAVFLSGNGPLVAVLREALARDRAAREKVSKANAEREVRSFVQNIHHFRDHYVANQEVPAEKVVVFDEAQRAWTREQASAFMQRKRGQLNFDMSEPEFLISVMDRHEDWCTIVCLIGGGQEINTGEAGFSEWVAALETRFPDWVVHVSPRISLPDYSAGGDIPRFLQSSRVRQDAQLHLAVSMRSFRAEALSDFIGHVVDNVPSAARTAYEQIRSTYPIFLTRDLAVARDWLRQKARGSERFGLVASSGAQRLRPLGIHMKAPIEPVNWFLNDASDVRSAFYLEEVASEFDVQGLELDWVGVCWDANFHHNGHEWVSKSFKGSKWQSVNDATRRLYLKNAHRVILTRARQGLVLCIPRGDGNDWTRPPAYYDGTYHFLQLCGLQTLDSDRSPVE
ncbi:DUF2075 domain-containing protein [Caballeronia sp. EK]|uniref:DUF2075 domain-containing protein n=1 Tax=Caballeronia sp. EK TaxID=2767469 RepID=UPI0016552A1E|nr:DUF2075 domain-containing protein [Caballeronia sp. EK]MBC8643016.1 DUF2075 domain-containing protein [Caballeronia sp. EK]